MTEFIKKNRELSSQLLLLQEEENQELAIDIHENLGQSMTVLAMQLDRLRRLPPEELKPFLSEIDIQKMEVVQQIRNLYNSLSMYMLRDVGLHQALQDFFNRVHNTTSLKINFRCDMPEERLALIVEMSIFRIIQQAVTNVLKYSKSNEIDISIEARSGTLNLCVADRVNGLMPDTADLNSTGVTGIRERAEVLGATLKVQSSGNETIVTVEIPLSSET